MNEFCRYALSGEVIHDHRRQGILSQSRGQRCISAEARNGHGGICGHTAADDLARAGFVFLGLARQGVD